MFGCLVQRCNTESPYIFIYIECVAYSKIVLYSEEKETGTVILCNQRPNMPSLGSFVGGGIHDVTFTRPILVYYY